MAILKCGYSMPCAFTMKQNLCWLLILCMVAVPAIGYTVTDDAVNVVHGPLNSPQQPPTITQPPKPPTQVSPAVMQPPPTDTTTYTPEKTLLHNHYVPASSHGTVANGSIHPMLHLSMLLGVAVIAAGLAVGRSSFKLKYDMDKIPGPWRHALPVLGNLLELIRPDVHRKALEWADEYGGIFRGRLLWHDGLCVTDPAALAVICGRGEGAMDKASVLYGPVSQMCSPNAHYNLLTSPADDTWRTIRKAVAASFAFNNIKKKFPALVQHVDQLCKHMRALGPAVSVDMDKAALRVTLDIIGLAGFGHDYKCVQQDVPDTNHLLRVLPRCFTEVMFRLANPLRRYFPWLADRGMRGKLAFQAFQDAMRALMLEAKARGMPDQEDMSIGAQLTRLLLEGSVEEERILSEIGILFVEGFETTGHTISWTLLNIATNPGVQDKIAAELDSRGLLLRPADMEVPEHVHQVGGPGRQLQLDDLSHLPYLIACIKEAMRMYPVVSVMGRISPPRPVHVGPYLIPPNTPVAIPLFAIHNTKHNWDDPLTFKPERWLHVPVESYVVNSKESSMAPGTRGITFMPFSEGPRNCVGQSLAKMEVIAVLAKLLAVFHVSLAPEMGGMAGVRSLEYTQLTLQVMGRKGIRMRLTPRDATPVHDTSTPQEAAFQTHNEQAVQNGN